MSDFEWSEMFFADKMEKAWVSFREKLAEDFQNCFDELHEVQFVEDEDSMLAFNEHELAIATPDGWEIHCSFYRPEEDIFLVSVRQFDSERQRELSGQNELVQFNSTNAVEAAKRVSELFRNDRGVVHPSFLKLSRNPEIAGSQNIPDNQGAGEPTEGFAQTEDQLRQWVSTALIDWNPSILTGTESGNFRIDTKEGIAVGIYTHTPEIVEICVNVADDLDEEIAKAALLEILATQSPFKYFVTEKGIIMSSYMHCVPFTKDVFLKMLEYHIRCTELMTGLIQEAIHEAKKSVAQAAELATAETANLDAHKKRIEELENELFWDQTRIEVLTKQRDWAMESTLVEDLQKQKQEAESKNEDLQQQLDLARQRIEEQAEKIAELEEMAIGRGSRVDKIVDQVRQQAELIDELRAQLDAQRDKHSSDRARMEAEKKAMRLQINELEGEIQEMREAEYKWGRGIFGSIGGVAS